MHKITILAGVLGSVFAFAQEGRVGINTENPKATLEVSGSAGEVRADGIIAPRLFGWQLRGKGAAYGADQKGAIVYVLTPPNIKDGKVKNVDAEGYYYFDGEFWVKFRPESTTYTAGDGIAINNGVISSTAPTYTAGANINIANNVISANVPTYTAGSGIVINNGEISTTGNFENLYTNDGTLAGVRTVSMNGNTLKFTGGQTTFVGLRDQSTINVKGQGHTYINFYKNDDNNRNAYFGYPNQNANYFELNNTVGNIRLTTPNNGVTELESKLKISNLPVEHNANNALLVTDQNGNVKKANLYQAGNGITINPNNNVISANIPTYTAGNGITISSDNVISANVPTYTAGNGISIDPATNTISATATGGNTEPWNVQGSTTQATANNQNIYQNGTVGIGDFSNQTATNTLDVNGSLRVRNLEPEHGKNLYNLAADENGVVIRISPQNFVEAGVVYASNFVERTVPNQQLFYDRPNLNLGKSIIVPKGRKYGIMVQVSVPMGVSSGGDQATTFNVVTNVTESSRGYLERVDKTDIVIAKSARGYYGINMKKTEDGVETDLVEVARKVLIPTKSDSSTTAMTTVNSQYYGIIDNSNGTTDKVVKFDVFGYIETAYNRDRLGLEGFNVRFNMWSPTGENYNWGKASLNYQIYSVQ